VCRAVAASRPPMPLLSRRRSARGRCCRRILSCLPSSAPRTCCACPRPATPWLKPYRNQLGAVWIDKWCDLVTPAMLSGQRRLHTIRLESFSSVSSLMRCLRGEQGGRPGLRLRCLILGRGATVQERGELLVVAFRGLLQQEQQLLQQLQQQQQQQQLQQLQQQLQQQLGGVLQHRPWQEAPEEEMTDLWASLADGVCPALEELDIFKSTSLGPTAPLHLRQGLVGCPELRRLRLNLFDVDDASIAALAEALERGLFPKLESLDIEEGGVRHMKVNEVIGPALQACPRPALRELRTMCHDSCQALIDALRWGACPGLTTLGLCLFNEEGEDVVMLVEGLKACPHLRVLSLGVSPQVVVHRSLADAMREGGLPCLEQLQVVGATVGNDDVVALAETLEARVGPKLRLLVLQKESSLDASRVARLGAVCENVRWIEAYPDV
jgi:hypothetical protein